ncbi:hypothetical protein GCM10019016_017100 [Streptomyces prasinosporus]|uniref:Uncharacterized protein n=1 Tax=Streptomyces prasinosporus TaxID=68256 RepID=A0ABP6TID6_9ACTN
MRSAREEPRWGHRRIRRLLDVPTAEARGAVRLDAAEGPPRITAFRLTGRERVRPAPGATCRAGATARASSTTGRAQAVSLGPVRLGLGAGTRVSGPVVRTTGSRLAP